MDECSAWLKTYYHGDFFWGVPLTIAAVAPLAYACYFLQRKPASTAGQQDEGRK